MLRSLLHSSIARSRFPTSLQSTVVLHNRRRVGPSFGDYCLRFSNSSSTKNPKISNGTIQNTTSQNDDDDMAGWIPPNRPLSGDTGQSHLHKRSTTSATAASKQVDDNDSDETTEGVWEKHERLVQELEEGEGEELEENEDDYGFTEDGFLIEDDDSDDSDDDASDDDSDDDGYDLSKEGFKGTDEEWERNVQEMKELEAEFEDENSNDDEHVEHDEEELLEFMKDEEKSEYDDDEPANIDWMATRRSKMEPSLTGMKLMTPSEAKHFKDTIDIPIIRHTLLTREEILQSLRSNGGQDITFLPITNGLMAEAKGLILATGTHAGQIRICADSLCRNLKARDLGQVGVMGAQLGPEAYDKHDTWQVVDCLNYVVHLFDESTRSALQLEKLWGPNVTDRLRKVRPDDDEDVDNYVAENPVPKGYNIIRSMGEEDFSQAISRLTQIRYLPPHLAGQQKQKRKSKSKKRSRQQEKKQRKS